MCAKQALAEEGQIALKTYDLRVPATNPDAAGPVVQGPVAFGLPPVSAGPPPSWPCFAPNAPCSSDPAGGLLVGIPEQVWPISGTTNCTQVACGQIFSLYETTTGSGSVSVTVSIAQGTTVIYKKTAKNLGTAGPNQIGIVDVTGIKFATTAVAGSAVITVTTTVGTNKVSGKTTIYLQ
jgi:hypothetical protein